MRILVLGKGVANDGVVLLLKDKKLDFDYLELEEVKTYDYEFVVKAPGIPYHNEIIKEFLRLNIKVMTDLELGMILEDKYYILVSGSNGKSRI